MAPRMVRLFCSFLLWSAISPWLIASTACAQGAVWGAPLEPHTPAFHGTAPAGYVPALPEEQPLSYAPGPVYRGNNGPGEIIPPGLWRSICCRPSIFARVAGVSPGFTIRDQPYRPQAFVPARPSGSPSAYMSTPELRWKWHVWCLPGDPSGVDHPNLPQAAETLTTVSSGNGVSSGITLDQVREEAKKWAWTKGDFRIVPYGILWFNMAYETQRTAVGDFVLYVYSRDSL